MIQVYVHTRADLGLGVGPVSDMMKYAKAILFLLKLALRVFIVSLHLQVQKVQGYAHQVFFALKARQTQNQLLKGASQNFWEQ
mmetsp:Transcript_9190/g.20307  ORF Transcript_9190/g.20307 Transcript_9190/m.20307 type:complete len:83 (+) Transcript_9190:50-298(+)